VPLDEPLGVVQVAWTRAPFMRDGPSLWGSVGRPLDAR